MFLCCFSHTLTHSHSLTHTEGMGYLFYLTSPSDVYETPQEVPKYVNKAYPFFFVAIALEFLVGLVKGKKKYYRANDSFSSMAAGMIQQVSTLLLRGIELSSYIWVYERFNYFQLPWNSPWTWWICFLGVDLGYYLFHRYAHEINIFWAAHVVHHSAENYNLTTALRQSFLQTYTSWFFYLPLAIAIPPSIFAIHRQFDTLFQFWIHTEVIGNLGPLEWILNTPSHHRVHHGRSRYCIDKNYAGTLIIWDRLFGTFAAESDPVVYGLTHPISTFDPIWTQIHHLVHVLRTCYNIEGISNKLSVLFKGPGWHPGTGRLGDINEIPDVKAPWPQHNPQLPSFLSMYVSGHFCLVIVGFILLVTRHAEIPPVMVLFSSLYVLYSLSSFGAMFDRKSHAFAMEISRIVLFLVLELVFWFTYGDDFVFLWYKDPNAPLYLHRPLKAVRAFYIFSGLWLAGRFLFFSFFGPSSSLDAATAEKAAEKAAYLKFEEEAFKQEQEMRKQQKVE